ncbi:MAG: hypothetical protein EHM33_21530 [Chloroflexi bacterium]|nr:MAG: hypothetical protein EHM33_21530 [Chloroflexota bacterium]
MTNVAEKPKRPSSITLISVFGIYTGFLSFYFIFRDGIQELALGNTLVFALGGIVFFVCGVGFWLMKKWAVYLYAIFAVINQVALFAIGRWNIFSLLLSAVIVYVGSKHLSKMS